MPYIKETNKQTIDDRVNKVENLKDLSKHLQTAGELNYFITVLIRGYFYANGGRYQQINDVVGALEGAKLEFTRRITNDYEDLCIDKNGDVY